MENVCDRLNYLKKGKRTRLDNKMKENPLWKARCIENNISILMDTLHSDFFSVKTKKDLLDLVEWRHYILKV